MPSQYIRKALWEREVDICEPERYRHWGWMLFSFLTEWIPLQMFLFPKEDDNQIDEHTSRVQPTLDRLPYRECLTTNTKDQNEKEERRASWCSLRDFGEDYIVHKLDSLLPGLNNVHWEKWWFQPRCEGRGRHGNLGNGNGLLFHHFVNRRTIGVVHFIKLIDATNTLVS